MASEFHRLTKKLEEACDQAQNGQLAQTAAADATNLINPTNPNGGVNSVLNGSPADLASLQKCFHLDKCENDDALFAMAHLARVEREEVRVREVNQSLSVGSQGGEAVDLKPIADAIWEDFRDEIGGRRSSHDVMQEIFYTAKSLTATFPKNASAPNSSSAESSESTLQLKSEVAKLQKALKSEQGKLQKERSES